MKHNLDSQKKQFPAGMVPLEKSIFKFACHAGVSCFTRCCRQLELYLYPYDIIRLKNRLGLSSEEFLNKYTGVRQGINPCFPSIVMLMSDNEEKTCPFLGDEGCTVYADRPSACRTYPLERAVDRDSPGGRPAEFYFMTDHSYCKGHEEAREWTVKEWVRDQQLQYYNQMDDLWAEMDTIFADSAVWQGEGAAGPRQLMAFMVSYNVDRFRQYVDDNKLLDQYKLDKSRKKLIMIDDEALLKFGFDWLKLILTSKPTLQAKR
ncbi:MAG: YkgJ family cysteine cluster protein [Proteobacteria bacterium]|nr:YkgJ family cysteine cluster protein [Pseudomonadota bacterium]MBU1714484.1 YkgJ family cysteine cluster protein [Pseudomonadota bacterium]